MPASLEPPELDRLVDFAERPRAGDWSLRSALVRYAQGQPRRVSEVLELVRRIDFALGPHAKLLQRRGPEVWAALHSDTAPEAEPEAFVVGVLRSAEVLDRVAERLASWAEDRRHTEPPDAEVDTAVREAARRLDDLGVTREEPPGPPARGRRR